MLNDEVVKCFYFAASFTSQQCLRNGTLLTNLNIE